MKNEARKQIRQDIILTDIEKFIDGLEKKYDVVVDYNVTEITFY